MWKPFEPGSSPIDWCEGNYIISTSIAEFTNTVNNIFLINTFIELFYNKFNNKFIYLQLSNILFLLLPPVLIHLFRDYGRFVNPAIHVIWIMLMFVGISSAYFHATLSLIGI